MQAATVTEHSEYTEVTNIPYEVFNKDVYCLDLFYPKQTSRGADDVYTILQDAQSPRERYSKGITREFTSGVRSYSAVPPAHPVVVFVHGGGWQRGDRRAWTYFIRSFNLLAAAATWFMGFYHNVGSSLAVRGIACAVITYPLAHLSITWTVLDFVSSYMCSNILCFVLLCTTALLLRVISIISGFIVSDQYEIVNDFGWIPKALDIENMLLFMSFTNIMILLVFLSLYIRSTILKYVWSPIIIMVLVTLVSISHYCLRYVVIGNTYLNGCVYIAMFTLTVWIRLYMYTRCRNILYLNQVRATSQAVRWVQRFGDASKYYDSRSLYLMGHSAGGHLVSTLGLGGTRTLEPNTYTHDIKGVISISGVYDLHRLSSSIFRRLYLHPAFGDNSTEWTRASPASLLKKGHRYPPFLVMTAQYDGHLNEDARQFCHKLEQHGVNVSRVILARTNHLTIMACFKSKNSLICDISVDFIQRTARLR